MTAMEARRKKAAETAATAPVAAAPAAAPAKAAPAAKAKAAAPAAKAAPKKERLTGHMRLIQSLCVYQELTPEMDPADGSPLKRNVFEAPGKRSPAIDASHQHPTTKLGKERVLPFEELVDHINSTVVSKVFGVQIKRSLLKALLLGINFQKLTLLEQGYKIKDPGLFTAHKANRKARKARNPKKPELGMSIDVPARATIVAKASKAAKQYLNSDDV